MFSFFVPRETSRQAVLITQEDLLHDQAAFPLALRVAFARNASHERSVREFLQQGYGVLVTTPSETAHELASWIESVARQTQSGTCHYWLSRAWLQGEAPVMTDEEVQQAADRGIPLHTHLQGLLQWRQSTRRIALADLSHTAISSEQARQIQALNADAAEWSWMEALHSYLLTRERARVPLVWAAAYSAIVIFPALLVLLPLWTPIAWLWATSAYDVWRSVRELRSSSSPRPSWRSVFLSWRPLFVSTGIRLMLIGLGVHWIGEWRWTAAGFAFGLALVAHAIVTLLHRLIRCRARYLRMRERGKIPGSWRLWAPSLFYDAWYAIPRMSLGGMAMIYPCFIALLWQSYPSLAASPIAMSVVVLGFFVGVRVTELVLAALRPRWIACLMRRRLDRFTGSADLDNLQKNA